jgi:phosphoesterase RecJ-like protein
MESAVATGELVYKISKDLSWKIDAEAARNLLAAIMSDTLGLTSQNVTAETYRLAAGLIDSGADISELEESRREFMKKSQRILAYKAKLIERVEYHLDGKLATVHIGWDDIQEYSDEYNPNVLILEEMRLVEGVEVAVAIKTYPDGKLTGKIRTAGPVAERVAGFFGGGGHKYAAGFRIYESYEQALKELVGAVYDILKEAGDEDL